MIDFNFAVSSLQVMLLYLVSKIFSDNIYPMVETAMWLSLWAVYDVMLTLNDVAIKETNRRHQINENIEKKYESLVKATENVIS